MNNIKRIQNELRGFVDDPPAGCAAGPIDGDLYHWTATIQGPTNTLYESGKFVLDIRFPQDYPFRPPACSFTTRILHPNISTKGEICLDTLKDNWSPILSI